MKKYQFEIPKPLLDVFFPNFRIKSKIQLIEILLEATRHMLFAKQMSEDKGEKMILYIDKMSRLFFFKENKYYSIAFPFNASEKDGKLIFFYNDDYEIDSQFISNVSSVIKDKSFDYKCSLDFVEPIYDIERIFDENFWIILKDLLMIELGYIRYDKDEKGHKEAKENGKEHAHPLNHFDIFYTNNVTFKQGLINSITSEEFIEHLNIKSDCKYLKNWS